MADIINRTSSLESVGMRAEYMGIDVSVRPERINYHRLGRWMAEQNPADVARFFDGLAERIVEYNELPTSPGTGELTLAEINDEFDEKTPEVDYLFEQLHTRRKGR